MNRRGLRRRGGRCALGRWLAQGEIDRRDVALLHRHRRRRGGEPRGRRFDPVNPRIDRHGRSHGRGGEHDVVERDREVCRLRRHTDGQPRYARSEVGELPAHQPQHVLGAVGLRLALGRHEVVERPREPSHVLLAERDVVAHARRELQFGHALQLLERFYPPPAVLVSHGVGELLTRGGQLGFARSRLGRGRGERDPEQRCRRTPRPTTKCASLHPRRPRARRAVRCNRSRRFR